MYSGKEGVGRNEVLNTQFNDNSTQIRTAVLKPALNNPNKSNENKCRYMKHKASYFHVEVDTSLLLPTVELFMSSWKHCLVQAGAINQRSLVPSERQLSVVSYEFL